MGSGQKNDKTPRIKQSISNLKRGYHMVFYRDDNGERFGGFSVNSRVLHTLAVVAVVVLAGFVFSVIWNIRSERERFDSAALREQLILTTLRLDSLEHQLSVRDRYFKVLQAITNGADDGTVDSLESISSNATAFTDPENWDFAPSSADSVLRRQVEAEEMLVFETDLQQDLQTDIDRIDFASPALGRIDRPFNTDKPADGIRLITREGAVLAILEGIVSLKEELAADTFLVQIQHRNNLTSTYRISGNIPWTPGSRIETGDTLVIPYGRVPHKLYFQLWYKGEPVNPERYIAFDNE